MDHSCLSHMTNLVFYLYSCKIKILDGQLWTNFYVCFEAVNLQSLYSSTCKSTTCWTYAFILHHIRFVCFQKKSIHLITIYLTMIGEMKRQIWRFSIRQKCDNDNSKAHLECKSLFTQFKFFKISLTRTLSLTKSMTHNYHI